MSEVAARSGDGAVRDATRVADVLAIQELATAYAYALDDCDWGRWEALFLPDARVDYTSAGGIAGTPAVVAAWLPEALAVFNFCLHSTTTHEVNFVAADEATGRVHVLNRNGAEWEGSSEIVDVAAVYEDGYRRVGGAWRFARRVERTLSITGGALADLIRSSARIGLPG